jgi:hypothetical protein
VTAGSLLAVFLVQDIPDMDHGVKANLMKVKGLESHVSISKKDVLDYLCTFICNYSSFSSHHRPINFFLSP